MTFSMLENPTYFLTGHTSSDQALGFTMLPFTVPPNTSRIDITYDCQSDLSFGLRPEENPHDYFADFAIFDPRGAAFAAEHSPAGFRGTSGNSHTEIFITPNEATPGYLAGELYAGEWQIMLGFYKVAPTGCNYQVAIRLTPGNSESHAPLPDRLPLRTTSDRSANATGWYKGDLHCHTFHSDGTPSPEAMIGEAERLGLDFLSITDHNTFTQQIAMNLAETDLMLIPGCEVTTFRGHWNIWGDAGWIDFRVTTPEEMEATIREAVAQGYLTSCNHPRPDGPPWRFPEVEGYQCVEAWNGGWWDNNETCLKFWEDRLKAGKRLVAVGGSDCHELHNPNAGRLAEPTTYIFCPGDPSPAGIIAGLRAGHAFITRDPNGPQLYLSSGSAIMGDSVMPADGHVTIQLRVVNGNGMQLQLLTDQEIVANLEISNSDVTERYAIVATDALYVRAQLRDLASGYVTALTNPIYFDRPAESNSAELATEGNR